MGIAALYIAQQAQRRTPGRIPVSGYQTRKGKRVRSYTRGITAMLRMLSPKAPTVGR